MPVPAGRPRLRPTAALGPLAATVLLALLAACGSDSNGLSEDASSANSASSDGTDNATVNLGLFPNVTHAPALVGLAEGHFAAALGEGVELNPFTFNAGTDAIEAVFAGAVDLTFIGPNPAINAFAQSDGEAIRIVAGTTSGGAYLVVTPDITDAAQLADRTLATPSLGNTQDVALRAWLAEQGFETTLEGGGDVTIVPQSNASTLDTFIAGSIDGAWVPEPWATRLVLEGGGRVLVDERDLWPDTGGEYVTTHLIARTEFLNDHPGLVKAVLQGLAAAIEAIDDDPAAAQAAVIEQIGAITGKPPSADVIAQSFGNLTFTLDPIAASLAGSAADAAAIGLIDEVDLDGIYDLSLLNEVLVERGDATIVSAL
jgi:NitT/TauT family transport system substrate-binding protein